MHAFRGLVYVDPVIAVLDELPETLPVSQVVRALCLGPVAALGFMWSVAASCVTILGDSVIAFARAFAAVGGSLMAFAPVSKAAATASKDVCASLSLLSCKFYTTGSIDALLNHMPRAIGGMVELCVGGCLPDSDADIRSEDPPGHADAGRGHAPWCVRISVYC